MTAEPEQWAVELWAEMYAAVYGCEPTHPAHMYGNAHRILQRAFEERERKLREALHDAINAPKGVVPASAEAFYDPALCTFRYMQTSLPNTLRYLASKDTTHD